MNRLLLLSILLAGLISCGDKVEKQSAPDNTADTKADSAGTYLPIADLLRDDIRRVDSFAAGILRKAAINGKQDSSFVKLPAFHHLARQFLLKELDSAYFRNNFKEASLLDESSRMVNFIYTPQDPESSLRRVMVYVSPSLGQDTPDRLYLETAASQGDTLIEKKLTWKMRKYFYIVTIKHPKSGDPVTTMEKLIWDPQHFAD